MVRWANDVDSRVRLVTCGASLMLHERIEELQFMFVK